jgi:hypothetical protein
MPEVVVPTAAADGSERTWNQVFPIWENDDENTEWRVIDQTLEAIAINNRCGLDTPQELQARLIKAQHEYFKEELAKCEGESYNKKEMELPITPERQAILDRRTQLFTAYGKWMFYYTEVFANFGAAWREHK